MPRRAPVVEWQIAQSDAEWEAMRAGTPDMATPGSPPWWRRHLLWRICSFVFVLGLVGPLNYSQNTRQSSPAIGEPAANRTTQLTAEQIERPQPTGTPLTTTGGSILVPPQRYEFIGNSEVARLLAHPEEGLRIYQNTTDEWLRNLLETLWGPERKLESANFVFQFRQRDAGVVAIVAPQLDDLYRTLQRNFGLTPQPAAPKLHITITQTLGIEPLANPLHALRRISAPSPVLYPPGEWNEVDLLAQSLALPLVAHALGEAVAQHRIGSARDPMLDGLRLWQLWDLDLPLAQWRRDLVRWIYVDLPTTSLEQPVILPEHYAALCAAHTLWLTHPAQLSIPLLCTELDRSPWRLPARLLLHPPRRLPRLDAPFLLDEYADAYGRTRPLLHPGEAIAVATLIEYTVATYGYERLPTLVGNLGRYATWEALVPVVFGVAAAEFEAGWQAYLREEYNN